MDMIRALIIGLMLLGSIRGNAQVCRAWPLAIVEVMAEPSTNGLPFLGGDYIRIHNYSETNITVANWFFSDSSRLDLVVRLPPITFPAGKSVIFARQRGTITNEADFAAWWGITNLPMFMWTAPGLDGFIGDEVWLYDSESNVVDWVKFGPSIIGHSFGIDTNTGIFGRINMVGDQGVIQSAQGGDIGTPSAGAASVPLQIVQQPVSQSNYPGEDVKLQVVATGQPRGLPTWLHNGIPVPSATEFTLTLTNVSTNVAGEYQVILCNGLISVTSAVATVTINVCTNCNPLIATIRPHDIETFPGQTAIFTVGKRGCPAGGIIWYSNLVAMAMETNTTLVVPCVRQEMSGTVYTARITNECSTLHLPATLTVVPRPDLEFSEIMVSPSQPHGKPWLEVINKGTRAVNLKGYRLADHMPQAFQPWTVLATITNDLVLQPGEVVIFLDTMSPAEFRGLWGENNLPRGLKIYTFYGFSFSANGEAAYLWNSAAIDPADSVANVTWARATPGTSMKVENFVIAATNCDGSLKTYYVGFGGDDSQVGRDGAFRAEQSGDIASPGSTNNDPRIIIPPKPLKLPAGCNAPLEVMANGSPLQYQWLFNGTHLPGQTSAVLNLTNAQATDAGDYSVIGSNAYGAITSQVAIVTVHPWIKSICPASNGMAITITFQGTINRSYQLQRNDLLFDNWLSVSNLAIESGGFWQGGWIEATNATLVINHPQTATILNHFSSFYRLVEQP